MLSNWAALVEPRGRAAARAAAARPLSARDARLSVVICVNGWVGGRDDFVHMWRAVRAPDADRFAVVWETKELAAIHSALGDFITKQAVQQAAQSALQHFFYT